MSEIAFLVTLYREEAFSMNVTLYIALESEHSRPMTLARVLDEGLLVDAGLAAIAQSERAADKLALEDRVLGVLQKQEAWRLRNALEMVIPGLRGALIPSPVM